MVNRTIKENEEFVNLQKELLRHKKLYYVENKSEISDYDYDMLERKSFQLAIKLGFNADRHENPMENEKHHVHWMIGFEENSKYEN